MSQSLRATLVGTAILAIALLACKKLKGGGADEESSVETTTPSTAKPATPKADAASPATTSTLPPVEPYYPPIVPIPQASGTQITPREKKAIEARDKLKAKVTLGKISDAEKRTLKQLCKETNDTTCDKLLEGS